MKKRKRGMQNRKSSEATSRNHTVPSALFPNYLSSNFFPLSTFRGLSSWSLLFSSGHFSSAWFTLIQFSTLGNDSHSWQKTPIYSLPVCVCPCVFVWVFLGNVSIFSISRTRLMLYRQHHLQGDRETGLLSATNRTQVCVKIMPCSSSLALSSSIISVM